MNAVRLDKVVYVPSNPEKFREATVERIHGNGQHIDVRYRNGQEEMLHISYLTTRREEVELLAA